MILNYESKKQMKEHIGEPLKYTETSMFGEEYKSDGTIHYLQFQKHMFLQIL